MTSLITNNSAMTALVTLKSISRELDNVSNRVSTGQRVAAASDNAAYWSIATTVRTDNASLGAVKDALGLGSSAVDTAYNGLSSVITDLQNIRAKLQSAMTPGVDRAKIQTEISAIQSKMKAIADSSNSSGQNWLSVDSSATNTNYQAIQKIVAGFSRGTKGDIAFSTVDVDVNSIKLYDTNINGATAVATSARIVGSTALASTAAFRPGTANAGKADFSGTNEVSLSLTLVDGATSTANIVINKVTMQSAVNDLTKVTTDDLVAVINNQIADSFGAGKIVASLDSAGRVTFQSVGVGPGISLALASTSSLNGNTLVDVGFGVPIPTPPGPARLSALSQYSDVNLLASGIFVGVHDNFSDVYISITPYDYYNLSPQTSVGPSAINGNDMAALITKGLASTGISHSSASFIGGKIVISTFEVGSSASVWVDADVSQLGFIAGQSANGTAATAGTAIPHVSSGTASAISLRKGILDTIDGATSMSIATIDISQLSGIAGDKVMANLISQIDKAISSVTDIGTKLGANKTQIEGQKNFVATLIKVNDRAIGVLVDADIEEESTKLKALQTQQQLAMQALSIANSSSQNLLSLFR
ncbi:flagellin [Methylobacterium sp. 17Sr1-1]|uniref:flagellin N-terminal helical domain-containing protein n=1 Tax=Methylobacterium sp. 17Sr1-1 TaxID=2202826 RepID=UPI000D6FF47F|nr:flagellin [Methylobacterium sp. 17Sr1-1]AWN52176.1 flagellin [Methylobacterium sp. 17Sr1-1]